MSDHQRKTVVKRNDLITASFRLTLVEQRILLASISQIDSRQTLSSEDSFSVTAGEILDLLSLDSSKRSVWRDLKTGTERLFERYIVFREGEYRHGKCRWVSRVEYIENEGRVEIQFASDVLKYLSELKREFTQYKIEYVSQFRSSYSIRVYELLVQWLSEGEREIRVADLREILLLEERYPKASELKRNVLDPACRDINAFSNLEVTYGQRKHGRTIVAFLFKFKLKKQTQKQKRTISKNKNAEFDGSDARPGETWDQYITRKRQERDKG
jgi:plasmid replication initiation protein